MALEASGDGVRAAARQGEITVGQAHRYLFAREFVAGRQVLDLACGDGQGAALLAECAAQVTAIGPGLDRDAASRRHPAANLRFLAAEAHRLPLPDASIDVALGFDALTASAAPDTLLAELKRVLRPGGLLIVSGAAVPAPGAPDIMAALRRHFAECALAGQRAVCGSALVFAERSAGTVCFERTGTQRVRTPGLPAAADCIGLASDAPLPPLFDGLLIETPEGRDAAADLQHNGQVAALSRDVERLQTALATQRSRAEAASTRLEIERQRANAIEASTIWRATKPLRQFLAAFPGLRRVARSTLRSIYRSRQTLRHHRAVRRHQANYAPLVSIIVPNFNHARFLPQRLDSILAQGYRNFELLILDDASTDDSAAVIERYRAAHPDRIRVLLNTTNSGNVFRQWQRGIAEARGALIWICESDDFAEPDFLENLVPAFLDESVMIGFGRIQFADRDGKPYPGLDDYRERAEPGLWNSAQVRPAKAWFDGGFGVRNVIPNVGGCLIRNQPVEDAIWQEATTYRILGDWYLYAMLARGGRLAYEPQAVSYFRQHGGNTSVSSFTTAAYYTEHERLVRLLRQRWGIPEATVERFAEGVRAQFDHAKAAATLGPIGQVFDIDRALATPHGDRHVLMVILGFYLGGGELFPIYLANQLVQEGCKVSVLALQPEDWNAGIRDQLDRRIAVYDAATVSRMGPKRFIEAAGVDLVHSHFLNAERLFFCETQEVPAVPYVVTLHGSYEVSPVSTDFVRQAARHVSHWVYLTRKNLDHLQVLDAAERARIVTSCIPNGMPLDPRPFGQSRAELGIGEGDLAFALVSRAMREKGWEPAIQALALAQQQTPRRLHLLLCGAGPEADRLQALYGAMPNVTFLGFQDRVHGLYRLADCAILPTRFQGESFPLTLIQAMQVGTPVIASDVGEIARMVLHDEQRAGLLVAPEADDAAFAASLAEAMLAMADDTARAGFGRDAAVLGACFGMANVAAAYRACYDEAIARHGRVVPQAGPAAGPALT